MLETDDHSLDALAAMVGDGIFDKEYYTSTYSDVRTAGVDPMKHYLSFGWKEGRNPSAIFDSDFYSRTHLGGRTDICPLLHYAQVRQFGRFATNEVDYITTFVELLANDVESLINRLSFDRTLLDVGVLNKAVLPMFWPDCYRQAKDLPNDVTDMECFLRYLVFDFGKGRGPGPLFDGAYYAKEAVRAGLDAPPDPENSYLHWLKFGERKQICPVEWFNQGEYVKLNADLEAHTGSPFLHFVYHGIKERRRFTSVAQIDTNSHPLVRTPLITQFLRRLGTDVRAQEEVARNRRFLRSKELSDICERAAALEPEIQAIRGNDFKLLPPWHDEDYQKFRIVRDQISGTFDNLIFVPFCKLGGADYVGGVLAGALVKFGRTIVVRTDQSDWVRPDWFPQEITSVDLSPWLEPIAPELRKRILYEIIRLVAPKNVFNVNSRLAFETFEVFAPRLQKQTNLFSYYFCADRTPDGREVGYPISFFANIVPYMKAAITDNASLGQTLHRRYCLPEGSGPKIEVLYTPAMTTVSAEPLAATQVAVRGNRRSPVILWAGRFDRQKRFDLLVRIAGAMQDVIFKCWGTAVLDPMPSLSDLPFNLIVSPPFKTYDELPLEESDGLLYTSAWDGLPTILIECGAMGMPMVASAVGGVPELVDETTGWPVAGDAEVADYVSAIRALLSDPEERVKRATALQARIAERHNRQVYRDRLSALIGQE